MASKIISICNWGKIFRKCSGIVTRRKCKLAGFEYVDACEKCDVVHMLWKKGELNDGIRGN